MKVIKMKIKQESIQFSDLTPGDCFIYQEHIDNDPNDTFIEIKMTHESAVFLEDGTKDCNIGAKELVYYATEVILGVE